MATLLSEQYTSQKGFPTGFLNTETHMITRYAKYTMLGTEASGDVIQMFDLPAGSFVHQVVLQWDDIGTGTITMTLGDFGGDVDRYVTSVDGDAAAGQEVMNGVGSGGFTAADSIVALTLNTASTTIVVGAVIRVALCAFKTSDSGQ